VTVEPRRWQRVSTGLRLVAAAMVIRLVVAVVATLGFLVVLATRDRSGMDVVAILLAAIGLFGQLLMVTGMFKVARQPRPPRSASLARVAGVLGIIGAAVSGYLLATLVRIHPAFRGEGGDNIQAAMDALRQVPRIELAAISIGWVALVLLLAAAMVTARGAGRPELARRARIALSLVAAGAITEALARLAVSPHEKSTLAAALVVATSIEVAGLVIGVVTARRLAEALLAPEPPPPELPRARSL